jgi:hypothetical protein
MRSYKGIIASLKEGDKAEVIIRPEDTGVPGASPQVNRCLCHCATDGSTLMVEALNRAGANVGDRVSISYDPSGSAKNAALLLGIPAAFLMTGILVATVLFHLFMFPVMGGVAIAAICLLMGIVLGVLWFRRISANNLPAIDQITGTRLEAASGDDENAFCMGADCRSCHAKT